MMAGALDCPAIAFIRLRQCGIFLLRPSAAIDYVRDGSLPPLPLASLCVRCDRCPRAAFSFSPCRDHVGMHIRVDRLRRRKGCFGSRDRSSAPPEFRVCRQ